MNKQGYTCCFTGYRPSKFPFPLDTKNTDYIRFENRLIMAIFSAFEEGTTTFISGMATGFDIIAAEAVLLLKEKNSEARLICAIPFKGQSSKYDELWKKRYDKVLSKADEIIFVSDEYHSGCYMKRNKYMVDNSDSVITYFDGAKGGTANTVKYAKNKGRALINIYEGSPVIPKKVKYYKYKKSTSVRRLL